MRHAGCQRQLMPYMRKLGPGEILKSGKVSKYILLNILGATLTNINRICFPVQVVGEKFPECPCIDASESWSRRNDDEAGLKSYGLRYLALERE